MQHNSRMKWSAMAAALALALPLAANAQQDERERERGFVDQARDVLEQGTRGLRQDADRIIADWPRASRRAAEAMIDAYGEPDGATPRMLVWHDNGPWHKTVVSRDAAEHNFPMPHEDVLAQTVHLEVPAGKFDDIARFDGSVVLERTRGTITARCDREEANFLALNLAQRIASDELEVDEARREFAQTMRRFSEDGTRDERLSGLQFRPMSATAAADPDERFERYAQQEPEDF